MTLAHIMPISFSAFRKEVKDTLNWGESHHLYLAAKKAEKENRIFEARLLSRANPQLRGAVRLGIQQLSQRQSYDTLFGGRSDKYVLPGSVASMFSPAAYLTELYRESRHLHSESSIYHLDKRRPDLQSIMLTQENQDQTLSTLELSNDILFDGIKNKKKLNKNEDVLKMLSDWRLSGNTPYHQPFETLSNIVSQLDPQLSQVSQSPKVIGLLSPVSLLGISSQISPELYKILTEEITAENAQDMYKKNFGDLPISALSNPNYLMKYYDIDADTLRAVMGIYGSGQNDDEPGFISDQTIVTYLDDKNSFVTYLITRTKGENYDWQVNFIEAIPTKDGKLKYWYNFKAQATGAVSTKISLNGHTILDKPDWLPELNKTYSDIVDFPGDADRKKFTLKFERAAAGSGGSFNTEATFSIETVLPQLFFLKLNKVIRLYKKTGITLEQIETAVDSDNAQQQITETVLKKIFYTTYYINRYHLSFNDALVLCNTAISQHSYNDQPSHFDLIFNNPPLNGNYYQLGGDNIQVDPEQAGYAQYDQRREMLKHALKVNDSELFTLSKILDQKNTSGIDNNLATDLSALYRVRMLAYIHQLSINELAILLKLSPYAGMTFNNISTEALIEVIEYLYSIIQWLQIQKISVYTLYMMTTTTYSTVLSPDINNLIETLRAGMQNKTVPDDQLIKTLAPFIAAALKLSSAFVAESILIWINKIKPNGMDVTAFWKSIEPSRNPIKPDSMVFCQVLGQLALIYLATQLTENALNLSVTSKVIIGHSGSIDHLGKDTETVRQLSRFAGWCNSLGSNTDTVLTALQSNNLDSTILASAMRMDERLLSTASEQANLNKQVAEKDKYADWPEIDSVLQWLAVANVMKTSPNKINALLQLDYLKDQNTTEVSYETWSQSADILAAGLNNNQSDILKQALEEEASAALSQYYIREVVDSAAEVIDRNDLYGYLLIDNQISAQVETTRLAEAIASIQQYINRALNGRESTPATDVMTGQFYQDWDRYNKRYSTWAGVSTLVYYPENYIDPTMRIGQTHMMDELLQSVSQSQLSVDTVEDAFKTYLTRFEQIANLTVVSGYHDNVNISQGNSYLVGKGETDANQYYWRKLDHSKSRQGKIAANAWSEWAKIDSPVNPYQGLIKPVIYKSRLYIVWLEKRMITVSESKDGAITSKDIIKYEIKIAHIRHDGTWNTPITLDVSDIFSEYSNDDLTNLAMYCSEYTGESTLLLLLYVKQVNTAGNKESTNTKTKGMYIYSDMTTKVMIDSEIENYQNSVYREFDTLTQRRLNNRYAANYDYPSSVAVSSSYEWGDYSLSMVYDSKIASIAIVENARSSDEIKLKIDANLRVIYNGVEGRQRHQCALIQKFGQLGDKFIVYEDLKIDRENQSAGNNNLFYPVYQYSGNVSKLSKGRLLVYRESSSSYVKADIGSGHDPLINENAQKPYGYVEDSKNDPAALKNNMTLTDNAGISTKVASPRDIDTAVTPANITIKASAGSSKPVVFNAETSVTNKPNNSLEEMIYNFHDMEFTIPLTEFKDNQVEVEIVLTGKADDGRVLGSETFNFTVTQKILNEQSGLLTLNTAASKAQYLQWGPYRTRINTLFAKNMVERAETGIDTLLTMDTQQLPEPKMGDGGFIRVTLPKYDPDKHGSTRNAAVTLCQGDCSTTHYDFWDGSLIDAEQTIKLFIPLTSTKEPFYNTIDFPSSISDGLQVFLKSAKEDLLAGTLKTAFTPSEEKKANIIFTEYTPVSGTPSMKVELLSKYYDQPMDFNGANSLYFWELFYYSPMLVAQRLLQEQNFDEANHWLKYVYSPEGYIVKGEIAPYHWNCRPLEEDTSWNPDPLDSTDPDAVAQDDPMHYKVSTFMRMLDLLIARGDKAYRQLERDTLNEAKLWYIQALNLLGDEQFVALDGNWSEPTLETAADKTVEQDYQHALMLIRLVQPAEYTANSLTKLFLPQQNDKLNGYWQTLKQRLYNLRHNLTIDGLPLSLPIYAKPADPKALLSAAVNASQGGTDLPNPEMPLHRFPIMLDNAKSIVSQLIQFGSTLQGIIERQDAEALNELLQNQARELTLISIQMQNKTLEELDAEKEVLKQSRQGAQSRFDSYSKLYDENINAGEKTAMGLRTTASAISTALEAAKLAEAGADMFPNIFGLAGGGSRWGAIPGALASVMGFTASTLNTTAELTTQSEIYRRRRQEWEIQRTNADHEVKQIDAQLKSLEIRREAAEMQKTYLETQQAQTQAQLEFLQRKFSNRALYNWMRGRLAAIYFQFYDLATSRCLMAQAAYQWETTDSAASFIKSGAWQGTYAGLLAGESLILNLVQMEDAFMKKDERALEITRTVSLAEVYSSLSGDDKFILPDAVAALLKSPEKTFGKDQNTLKIETNQLEASVNLSGLKIWEDYPQQLGAARRIKQVSVSLPALLGPYQDVQAILSYSGDMKGIPKGCSAIAVSNGMNDSGQFQLDFNDTKYLPFEGINIPKDGDKSALVLSFPNANAKQKTMLLSLSDIILHIRYTIRK
ncbi:neuraminidase-like domain-containing protein [Xenorhabdus bovienii]|nr:neuraminidase-like domain-containing protein [Xenorhabdus bovienii]